jgi:hypothetical protein
VRPEADGDVVGHELALARVLQELLAVGRVHVHRAENIAAGAVIETGNLAENFALRALAGARRAKKKKRSVNHDQLN